jgi:hypothetical protein
MDQPRRIRLPRQGSALVRYVARGGSIVELYTSMVGVVGYPCPPYAPSADQIAQNDHTARHRVLRVGGHDAHGRHHQVVGFFEPVAGLERGEGAVAAFCESRLTHTQRLRDHTLVQHFERTLAHFAGQGDNPCPADRALRAVQQLYEWSAAATSVSQASGHQYLERALASPDGGRFEQSLTSGAPAA